MVLADTFAQIIKDRFGVLGLDDTTGYEHPLRSEFQCCINILASSDACTAEYCHVWIYCPNPAD